MCNLFMYILYPNERMEAAIKEFFKDFYLLEKSLFIPAASAARVMYLRYIVFLKSGKDNNLFILMSC